MTMTQHDNHNRRGAVLPRRATLLASVAVLGIAIGVGTADVYRHHGQQLFAAQAAELAAQPAGFADLVARVKPAVISVRVQMDQPVAANRNEGGPGNQGSPQGAPFDQHFRQFGPQRMPQMENRVEAEGSGFFISPDGYAMTNNHVVDHATNVQITTDDGRTMQAKVVGTDPATDLALIKVDGNNLPYVKFANHDPRIGDWVIAVGNPFGLGGTVTAGVVSARGRDIGSGPYDDFIQIDAPINKGNSGGPAFDVNGNVIGVNTAIFSPSGGSVGIGFDIPADTAKMVVQQLKDHGRVIRGWMGVQVQAVTPDIAQGLGLKSARGALVDEPQPGSPAAKAGIMSGDVITAVNGKEVKDSRDLAKQIGDIAPGAKAELAVLHDGGEKTVAVTLGTLPVQPQARAEEGNPTPGESQEGPRLGMTLAPGDGLGNQQQGVAVTSIDPNGAAAQHGIRAGDVILDVGGKAVSRPSDVRNQLLALRSHGKQMALMRLKSGNGIKFVAVPLGKA
jgi:serine protease Do